MFRHNLETVNYPALWAVENEHCWEKQTNQKPLKRFSCHWTKMRAREERAPEIPAFNPWIHSKISILPLPFQLQKLLSRNIHSSIPSGGLQLHGHKGKLRGVFSRVLAAPSELNSCCIIFESFLMPGIESKMKIPQNLHFIDHPEAMGEVFGIFLRVFHFFPLAVPGVFLQEESLSHEELS